MVQQGFFNKEPLEAMLLKSALQGPQIAALNYFKKYFDEGGTAEHPALGDLHAFKQKIDQKWDSRKGLNLVAHLIATKLEPSLTKDGSTPG